MTEIYDQLNRALAKAGLPESATKIVQGCPLRFESPLDVIVNMGLNSAPFADILLEYAPKLIDPSEIEFVARSMSQNRGFRHAVPWLLSLFKGYPKNGLNEVHLWAIGNAIYTIDNKEHYADVIAICSDRNYGSSRQMLMGTLARAKSKEAYDLLLKCLHDLSVRAHAIEAIGRFGNPDAIPILEALEVKKGLYEYKAKQTALRRLRRKL